MELVEIQSVDPVKVAITKAYSALLRRREPVLIEDVAFGFDEVDGFPGALYAPTEKALGINGILLLASGTSDRRATATTVIAFADIGHCNVHLIKAELKGRVTHAPRGKNGFGFDPIFVPDCHDLTLAEMSSVQKNLISMRRLAIEKMLRGEWETHNLGASPLKNSV